MKRLLSILSVAALLLAAGCPPQDKHAPAASSATPTAALPAEGPLLDYDKLRLGMDAVGIAQAYNAPDGRGDGFRRVVQDFDGVQHHIVLFDEKTGQPQRRLVLALLRDELYQIVDRRDGLSAKQADAWRAELEAKHGKAATMPVAGAQWSWGEADGVLLTFTQDNASENSMSANVVLVFKPYADAGYSYLEDWQRAHPDYKAEDLPF
jgi:hypothetical protein